LQNLLKYLSGISGNKRPIKLAALLLIITILAVGLAGCTDVLELDVDEADPVEDGHEEETSTEVDEIEGILKVHYIDIGQGDSIFIELPNGEKALIDGGPRSSEETLLNYLDEQGVERIDYLVATHPHEDHIGGLDGVINNYDIGKIYMPDVVHTTKTFENLLLAIQDKGYKITRAMAGDTIVDMEGLGLYILAPEEDADWEDLNNYSVVVRLEYKNNSFLFTGDAEKDSEDIMISKGYDLKAEVLKVGHHGSTTSTTDEFLDRVDPKYAIISCGADNKYGHPHKEILAKLEEKNIEIYRTDIDGTIVVKSDGKSISFK